jgi:hypothetical protein
MSNQIRNLPVTLEDVNLAEKLFGPAIGALKVKTTQRKLHQLHHHQQKQEGGVEHKFNISFINL